MWDGHGWSCVLRVTAAIHCDKALGHLEIVPEHHQLELGAAFESSHGQEDSDSLACARQQWSGGGGGGGGGVSAVTSILNQ